MLRIVLDTNVFCADFFLNKPAARSLRDAAAGGRVTVHVSQVVVDEVKRRYSEDVKSAMDALRPKLEPLSRGRFGQVLPVIDTTAALEAARAAYPATLDDLMKLDGFVVEPYPAVTHQELVKRDLERMLPFKPVGSSGSKGYRDALIWCTVLEIAERCPDDEVVFVTNNTDDFMDTDKKATGKRGTS